MSVLVRPRPTLGVLLNDTSGQGQQVSWLRLHTPHTDQSPTRHRQATFRYTPTLSSTPWLAPLRCVLIEAPRFQHGAAIGWLVACGD